MTQRLRKLCAIFIAAAVPLAACGSADDGSGYLYGSFEVSQVQAPLITALPAEIDLVVVGEFPDSCTEIDQVTQQRAENTVNVTITTRRPIDQSCAQTTVEHTERVRLGTFDATDTYTFIVNGVQTTVFLGSLPTPVPTNYEIPVTTAVESPDGVLRMLLPEGWAAQGGTGEIRVAATEAALTEEPIPSSARLVVLLVNGPSRAQDFGLDGATIAEVYALFAIRADARVGPPQPLEDGKWTGVGGHGDDPLQGSRDLRILVAADGSMIAAMAFAPPGEWQAFQPLVEAMLESLETP